MSKRLQVLIDDREYRRFRQMARRRGMTLAEWVRQALRVVGREEPEGGVERKLAALRAAASHDGPTGDIERMLEEIERGYLRDGSK